MRQPPKTRLSVSDAEMTSGSEGNLWHSSDAPLTRENVAPGLHAGSREQAVMRRPKGILHRIVLDRKSTVTRMRDRGHWETRRMAGAARRADVALYLNRFEGVHADDLDAAILNADASDAEFRRLVPSASYSWIILRPQAIVSIERQDG